jgi:hypothetical protein
VRFESFPIYFLITSVNCDTDIEIDHTPGEELVLLRALHLLLPPHREETFHSPQKGKDVKAG